MIKNFLLPLIILIFCSAAGYSQVCYITKTGNKYHLKNCSYLVKSSITIELEEAINNNYTSCSRCKPTKEKLERKDEYEPKGEKSNNLQCLGITQSGKRCKIKATNSSGYCNQHGTK